MKKGYWEVCGRCDGEGKHVNPSIDGNGIWTGSELWADDDFRDSYMSGVYDVTCEECKGRTTIWISEEEDDYDYSDD